MPACVPASPAVVMVRTPSTNDSGSAGIAIALHRIGAIGSSTSWQGADRHRPMSAFSKRPKCATVGRMRYSQERSLVVRGAVKGEPLSCSAYRP